MSFYVYILKCADGSYYTGHTDNLEARISAHQDPKANSWVSKRLPVELVYADSSPTRQEALEFEFQVKKWSRAKKEALIARDWERLKLLSKSYSSRAVHGSTSSPRTGVSVERAFTAECNEASPRTGERSVAESAHAGASSLSEEGNPPVRGELVEPRDRNKG
jgi:predicted GIY-YIG superfamily endonuclease